MIAGAGASALDGKRVRVPGEPEHGGSSERPMVIAQHSNSRQARQQNLAPALALPPESPQEPA